MNQQLERPGPPPIIWVMALVFVAFEVATQLATAGFLPFQDLQTRLLLNLAFFDPWGPAVSMLETAGVRPELSRWGSALTYAFLHGGALHLVMNGAIFLALGGALANMIGGVRFLILFCVTAIAGALFFAWLSEAEGPLVGASGAIFGFFGALKRWEWLYIRATGASPRRFWGTIAALVAMNLALFVFYPGDGAVAWEAHLGGFVAGWFLAPLLAPGRAGPSPI